MNGGRNAGCVVDVVVGVVGVVVVVVAPELGGGGTGVVGVALTICGWSPTWPKMVTPATSVASTAAALAAVRRFGLGGSRRGGRRAGGISGIGSCRRLWRV